MQRDNDHTLGHLLDRVETAAQHDDVTLRDVLEQFGERSITPFILLAALLLVSPLSGVIGMSSFIAVLVIVLSAQALVGRKRLWLPAFLLGKKMRSKHLHTTVRWLRKPCAFFDRHSGQRLQFLTTGPMRFITLLTCTILPVGWPFLEFVPFASSFGGGTVALFAFGLFTRDGLYVLLGYVSMVTVAGIFYIVLF